MSKVVERDGMPTLVYGFRERAAMALRSETRDGMVTRWTPRLLMLAAVAYPRDLLHMAHAWFQAWTALPGDRFRDAQRQVTGTVLGGRPGAAVLRCRTDEGQRRHPALLDVLPPTAVPTMLLDESAPGGFVVPDTIERGVDLRRWWRL